MQFRLISFVIIAIFVAAFAQDDKTTPQLDLSAYKRNFDRITAQIHTAFSSKDTAERQIQFKASGLLIATVGPPARGKSYALQTVESVRKDVRFFNAGDVRRIWETAMENPKTLERFLDKFQANEEEREAWLGWLDKRLKSTESVVIPGHYFGTTFGKKLNNFFAGICLEKAMMAAKGGQVAFFDATNTDIPRRKAIMKMTQSQSIPLLFVENLCTNPTFLFQNFVQKIIASKDYAHKIKKACNQKGTERIQSFMKERKANLVNYRHVLQRYGHKKCRQVFQTSLNDILTRDNEYLTKYTPLHMAKSGLQSTIKQINDSNRMGSRFAYLQVMIEQCKDPELEKATKTGTLWNANVDLDSNEIVRKLVQHKVKGDVDTYKNRKNEAYDPTDITKPSDELIERLRGFGLVI